MPPLFLLPLLLLLLLLLLQVIISSSTITNCCPDTAGASYANNGSFRGNLNILLSSLSTNVVIDGFSNDTVGEHPDQAFGLAICQGDLTSDECGTCLKTAVQDVLLFCPSKINASLWEDKCFVRYSNVNFFSTMANKSECQPNYWYSSANMTSDEIKHYGDVRTTLLSDLIVKATKTKTTPSLYAAGSRASGSLELYGLVFCTRDLSASACSSCLDGVMEKIPIHTNSIGARYLSQSCFLRYETYVFFNLPTLPNATSPTAPMASGGEKKNNTKTVIIVVPIVAGSLMVLAAIFIFRWRSKYKKLETYGDVDMQTADSLLMDLQLLKNATCNFSDSNKLGVGGFGPVYKGILPDGKEIAVKRLARDSTQGLVELKNEVAFVAKLQHKNLVRLLGFCIEKQEMLLVYEYLPNTSLDRILYDPVHYEKLDWGTRFKIIEGIARGLLYLHEDSRLKIIHRDLKSNNILLDGNMNPKISDFGLAKLFLEEETQGDTSRAAGTYGYMAPEYVIYGKFSSKSDVYSFGVMVLEIVTGQKTSSFHASGNYMDLIRYVWRYWNEGTTSEVVDERLDGKCSVQEVRRCVHIALLCVQEDPSLRPSMSSVLLMLSSFSTTLPSPSTLAWEFTATSRSHVNTETDGELDALAIEYSERTSSNPPV